MSKEPRTARTKILGMKAMNLIVRVTSADPRVPLAQVLRVPLGLDVWEVKPNHLLVRANEMQVDRLVRMGYTTEQVHETASFLENFATPEALAGYHSAESIEQDLRALETRRPEIAQLHRIGSSVENRPIWALQIGERRGNAARILFMGCHHAREWISVELIKLPSAAMAALLSSTALALG